MSEGYRLRYAIGPAQKALAEASGALSRRGEGNPPLILPKPLYDALEAAGTDMKDLAPLEPTP